MTTIRNSPTIDPKRLQQVVDKAAQEIKQGPQAKTDVAKTARISDVIDMQLDAFVKGAGAQLSPVSLAELKSRVTDAVVDAIKPWGGPDAAQMAASSEARAKLGIVAAGELRSSLIGGTPNSFFSDAMKSDPKEVAKTVAGNVAAILQSAKLIGGAALHDAEASAGNMRGKIPSSVLAESGAKVSDGKQRDAEKSLNAIVDSLGGGTHLFNASHEFSMKQVTASFFSQAGFELNGLQDALASGAGRGEALQKFPIAAQMLEAHQSKFPDVKGDAAQLEMLSTAVFAAMSAGGMLASGVVRPLREQGGDLSRDPLGVLDSLKLPKDRADAAHGYARSFFEDHFGEDAVKTNTDQFKKLLGDQNRPNDVDKFLSLLEKFTTAGDPHQRNMAAVVLSDGDIREGLLQCLNKKNMPEDQAAQLPDIMRRVTSLALFPKLVFAEPLPN